MQRNADEEERRFIEVERQRMQQELWEIRYNTNTYAERERDLERQQDWPTEQTIFQKKYEAYLRTEQDREREQKKEQELYQSLHDAETRAEQEQERPRAYRSAQMRGDSEGTHAEEIRRVWLQFELYHLTSRRGSTCHPGYRYRHENDTYY